MGKIKIVIVEPSDAWIKQVLGFRQFSFNGIEKVRCEFKLVGATLNLPADGGNEVMKGEKRGARGLDSEPTQGC